MARGGPRPGAGRPRKSPAKAPKVDLAAGHVGGDGVKKPGVSSDWPFGTVPQEPPALPAEQADLSKLTPLDFLLSVMRDPTEDKARRINAAQLAAPYVHAKKGEGGKKVAQQEAAEKVSRFGPAQPPRLAAAGGKKV